MAVSLRLLWASTHTNHLPYGSPLCASWAMIIHTSITLSEGSTCFLTVPLCMYTNWLVSIRQMSPCVQHMKCTSTKPLADWWTIAMICNKPGPVLAALCSSKFMLLSRSCSVSALMKSSNSRSPGGSCVEGLTQEGAGRESSVTLLTLGEKTKTQRDIANTGRENKNTAWHC